MDFEERIRAIICEQLLVEEEDVTREITFESLGADSLDKIELITALEDEFGIEISGEDAKQIRTVGDAARFVDMNAGKKITS